MKMYVCAGFPDASKSCEEALLLPVSSDDAISRCIHACRYISVDKPPPATAPHFSTPVEDATDLIAADDSKVTKKKSKRTKPEAAQLTSPAQTQTTPRVSIAPPAAATVAVVAAATSNPQPPAVHSVHSTQSAQQPSEVQTTMHEFQVVTAAHTKPHALLALLAELQTPECAVRAIVFASAVDAARRLTNLLEGSGEALGLRVFEMSSRVASRVQVETLAALQREPSWCALHCILLYSRFVPTSTVFWGIYVGMTWRKRHPK